MSDTLDQLRGEIERVDASLVALIAERVRLARAVGDAKRASGIATLDHAREAAVIRRVVELAREAGLPDDDVRAVFWQVIGISRRAQLGEEGRAPPLPTAPRQ